MPVKYHPPMLYYIAVIATSGTLIGAVLAWLTVHLALRNFQGTVEDAIGRAVSLQDDRIRKGRERDGVRTTNGPTRQASEEQQVAAMMAGQPIEYIDRSG